MFVVAIFGFIVDRLLKQLSFKTPEEGVILISDLFRFTLHENFGIVANLPLSPKITIFLSFIILIFFVFLLLKSRAQQARLGLFLIIIGALSNLTDRLLLGYVVDYLLIFNLTYINVADIMIWLGIAQLLFLKR